MQIYLVGGAVRDALMGLSVQDRDWVVVGATPEQMTALGYTPVGRDFPVFLHPQTHEEFALARTERKTARGYRGFAVQASPEVTLEEDLARRDLTINAIALPLHALPADALTRKASHIAADREQLVQGLIDPYGGAQDISHGVFRHVTPAFREDPVRILRVARLAARFTDFSVAPDTQELMQHMVQDGEVNHLVPERVWQELSRGLMGTQPSRMFEVLRACGALHALLPEVDRLWGVPQSAEHHPEIDTGVHLMMVLDMAARLNAPLPVRYACLGHDLGKGTTPADVLPRHIGHEERSVRLLRGLGDRLRVPNDCKELATVVAREHGNIHRASTLGAAALLRLLERCDALRQAQRFEAVLLACECDARGRLHHDEKPYPQATLLRTALLAAQSVATEVIAAQAQAAGLSGLKIGELIHQARAQAIEAALK